MLRTQPDSDSSSDFDSSDSDNDSIHEEAPKGSAAEDLVEEPVAGPSSPRPASPPAAAPVVTGGALKKASLPAPGLGGALKKSVNGQVVQPRVVVRQKMVSSTPR